MSSPAAQARRTPRYLDVADRVWPVLFRFTDAHTFLYRHSGGRIGRSVPGLRGKMLLLDHVGAKSGTLRTAPLLYVDDGPNVVIVASKGGFPKHPAWYHNLLANPDTIVQIGTERRSVHARLATPEEYDALWDKAVEAWGGYREYKRRTDRKIPLVVLEPR